MRHSVRRSFSKLLLLLLAPQTCCCLSIHSPLKVASQARKTHTRAAMATYLPTATWHMLHATCRIPTATCPCLAAALCASVRLNEFTCCYASVWWMYVCVCRWVSVCVPVCVAMLPCRQQQLLAQFCLFACLNCCLLGYFPHLALPPPLFLSLSCSLIKIQFKIFDLILFARRFANARSPRASHALCHLSCLNSASATVKWVYLYEYIYKYIYVCMYVRHFMHGCARQTAHSLTQSVSTWARNVCQLAKMQC